MTRSVTAAIAYHLLSTAHNGRQCAHSPKGGASRDGSEPHAALGHLNTHTHTHNVHGSGIPSWAI